MVREQMATPGTVVTESKMLRDAVTGENREVDVVVQTLADGDPFVISMEVVDRGRPADVTWVEQMIKKHQHLPTNLLMLVSWSGFAAGAERTALAEGGRVVTTTPKRIEQEGLPLVKRLVLREPDVRDTHYIQVWTETSAGITAGLVSASTPVFAEDGTTVGTAGAFAQDLLRQDWSVRDICAKAKADPDAIDGAAFSIHVVDFGHLRRFLRDGTTEQLHEVVRALIGGIIHIRQSEIDFSLHALGHRLFGVGESVYNGERNVWVATTVADQDAIRLSRRALGKVDAD